MKARIPQGAGGGNMQALIKKAQQVQEDMAAKQAELEDAQYSASAGGGAVTATVDGRHMLVALTLEPDAVDPEDTEMLADLVMAAVNEAVRKAIDTSEAEMARISSAMPQLPGMPGMF